MTDLSRDKDPDQPTKGQSGEGVNSADHVERKEKPSDRREHQETLIDEAVDETFPASDPIAPKRIT